MDPCACFVALRRDDAEEPATSSTKVSVPKCGVASRPEDFPFRPKAVCVWLTRSCCRPITPKSPPSSSALTDRVTRTVGCLRLRRRLFRLLERPPNGRTCSQPPLTTPMMKVRVCA